LDHRPCGIGSDRWVEDGEIDPGGPELGQPFLAPLDRPE
jgi:hypothetical protein